MECYEAGQYTLAVSAGAVCAFHTRLRGPVPARPGPVSVGLDQTSDQEPVRRPEEPGRVRSTRRRPAGARAREYGRQRAAHRVDRGRWSAHPGWRHFVPAGAVVLTGQAAALRRVEQLAAGQGWREDRRVAWTAILRALVHGMCWSSGLVSGVTAAQLAAAGGRSQRTVSAVLAWARKIELLAVVEEGASASFLGSTSNRAPSYVFLAGPATTPAGGGDASTELRGSPISELLCDLPVPTIKDQPLPGGRRLERPTPPRWPLWRIPETPTQRSTAVSAVVRCVGLDRPQTPLWRMRAALASWFEAGWCPAGLLWALDHHPDRTDQHRGDALRGAHDPIRVLLARLAPWSDRLDRLPPHLHGKRGDYQARQAQRLAARVAAAKLITSQNQASGHQVTSSPTHRATLRAAFAHQRRPR